jgi:chromosome segregation ATPase
MENQTSSRVIGFRIPLTEYIHLLQCALEAKMSMSDFVLSKLYQDDKVAQLKSQLEQQGTELTQTRKLLTDSKVLATRRERESNDLTALLSDTAQKAAQERERLQNQLSTLTLQVTTLREAENTALLTRATLTSEAARLTSQVKTLTTQNAALTTERNTLMAQLKNLRERAANLYRKLEGVHHRAFMGAVTGEAWKVLEPLKNFG